MGKRLVMFCICISLSQSHAVMSSTCATGQLIGRMTGALGAGVMQRLVERSVVKVTAGDYVGSGVIWEIEDGRIIIAASRHLLRMDVAAAVTLDGETAVQARSMGYSQQYDVGFLEVPAAKLPPELLQGLYAVKPVMYETGSEADRAAFAAEYAQWEIMQLGVDTEQGGMGLFAGSIMGIGFVPVFNTHVLETACYAKAGMSGGGVFDRYGRFWGLICGGEVEEDAGRREAELTYSLPPQLVAEEYIRIKEANEE